MGGCASVSLKDQAEAGILPPEAAKEAAAAAKQVAEKAKGANQREKKGEEEKKDAVEESKGLSLKALLDQVYIYIYI